MPCVPSSWRTKAPSVAAVVLEVPPPVVPVSCSGRGGGGERYVLEDFVERHGPEQRVVLEPR